MRSILPILIFVVCSFVCNTSFGQVKILFDATKAESISNADWVIDADVARRPQMLPTPAQSTVTANTAENYWTGGLSNWGIDCVKKGYFVETLPTTGKITYGDATNSQDLSKYTIFIVCEPNTQFAAAEKTAIMNFVKNGGGLFMISDHTGSDRNGDGWDSPAIWNDFLTTNSVQANPFGISFDLVNISGTSSTFTAAANDSLIHGAAGDVTQVKWSNGTTITISTAINPSVKASVFQSGSSNTGSKSIMCAYARYGKGRVVAIGDSSPFDDGTGCSGATLYNGYTGDAVGNHEKLIMNATIWLATLPNNLPVKFTNIMGNNKNNSTVISWQADESNIQCNEYSIQRSIDGIHYTEVATATAKKPASGIASYTYTVNETLNSNIYYRIAANENGSINYSHSVEIFSNKTFNSISIYPNPTTFSYGGSYTISGLSIGNKVSVRDIQGKLLYQTKANNNTLVWNGTNRGHQKLAVGLYFVTITDADNKESVAGKIVVTKN